MSQVASSSTLLTQVNEAERIIDLGGGLGEMCFNLKLFKVSDKCLVCVYQLTCQKERRKIRRNARVLGYEMKELSRKFSPKLSREMTAIRRELKELKQ